jgi:hypothetical protein
MSLRTTEFPLHPAVVSRRPNFTPIGTHDIIRRLQHGIPSHHFFFSNGNFCCRHSKLGNQRYKPVPMAVRLNVALLVGSSITSDWRSFTLPIAGI